MANQSHAAFNRGLADGVTTALDVLGTLGNPRDAARRLNEFALLDEPSMAARVPGSSNNFSAWSSAKRCEEIMEVMAYLARQRWLPPGYGDNDG